MSLAPSILEAAINQAIGDFVQAQLGVPTVVGQTNRVPQPAPNADSVVFWPLSRPRLSTNAEGLFDVKFTGSIAGSVLTVSAVQNGVIVASTALSGVGIAPGTTIQSQSSGTPGGVGAYAVSGSQTVGSETMSASYIQLLEETELNYQIDVHGPNSADNSQALAQLLWSNFAYDSLSPSGVFPLYCEDPQQIPFMTAADQTVNRWIVRAKFQINPIVSIPQQFADSLTVTPSIIL